MNIYLENIKRNTFEDLLGVTNEYVTCQNSEMDEIQMYVRELVDKLEKCINIAETSNG